MKEKTREYIEYNYDGHGLAWRCKKCRRVFKQRFGAYGYRGNAIRTALHHARHCKKEG